MIIPYTSMFINLLSASRFISTPTSKRAGLLQDFVVVCVAEERKMKILEEFWYGNIHPTERNIVSNSRVDKLLELVVKNEQQLIDLLSEQEQATFQELRNVQDELSGVNECESFTRGFRLGARFMLEIMEDMNLPFIES